jgi:hypothetical protein
VHPCVEETIGHVHLTPNLSLITSTGAHFAELSLFLDISNVLAMFNISKTLDKDGQEIEPPIAWFTGITMFVPPM